MMQCAGDRYGGLQVRMSPKVSPPSPLGGLLKGQAVDQVGSNDDMIMHLLDDHVLSPIVLLLWCVELLCSLTSFILILTGTSRTRVFLTSSAESGSPSCP